MGVAHSATAASKSQQRHSALRLRDQGSRQRTGQAATWTPLRRACCAGASQVPCARAPIAPHASWKRSGCRRSTPARSIGGEGPTDRCLAIPTCRVKCKVCPAENVVHRAHQYRGHAMKAEGADKELVSAAAGGQCRGLGQWDIGGHEYPNQLFRCPNLHVSYPNQFCQITNLHASANHLSCNPNRNSLSVQTGCKPIPTIF